MGAAVGSLGASVDGRWYWVPGGLPKCTRGAPVWLTCPEPRLTGEAHTAAWCPFLRGLGFVLLDALEGLQVHLGPGDAGLRCLALVTLAYPCGSGHGMSPSVTSCG